MESTVVIPDKVSIAKDQGPIIIHLEDNEQYAWAVRKALGEFQPRWLCARDAGEFRTLIESHEPRIIISANTVHDLAAKEALALSRSLYPQVGFIAVTPPVSKTFASHLRDAGIDAHFLVTNLLPLTEHVREYLKIKRHETSGRHLLPKDDRLLCNILDISSQYGFAIRVYPDQTLSMQWVNPMFSHDYDITEEDRKAGRLFGVVHRDDFGIVMEAINHVFNGKKWTGEVRLINRLNQSRLVRGHVQPESDRDTGAVAWIYGVFHDITLEKAAMNELASKARQASEFLEQLSECVVAVDKEAKYTYMNKKAAIALNADPVTAIGKHYLECSPERPGLERACRKAFSSQRLLTTKIYYPEFQRWVDFTIHPSPDGLSIFFRETGERRKTKKSNLPKSTRLLSHVENSPLAIIEWNHLLQVKSWSPQAAELFGWTEAEAKGMAAVDIAHPEDRDKLFQTVSLLMSGKNERNQLMARCLTRKRKTLWTQWFNSAQRDDRGHLVAALTLIQDVTDRQHLEQCVRNNERRFRSLIENITDGIVILDADLRIQYQSPSVRHIMGYAANELSGHAIRALVQPDAKDDFDKMVKSLTSTLGRPLPFDCGFSKRDGTPIQLEGVATNLLHVEGVHGYVLNFRDISHRRTTENALIDSYERYEILSRATNDAIWDWDITTGAEKWNHGLETVFGYSEDVIKSSSRWWQDKVHPEDYARVNSEMEAAFAKRATHLTMEFRYLCAEGTYKSVLDRSFIIYHNDKPVRMIGAMQDVTRQKHFEARIIETASEWANVIENASAPIFGIDSEGRVNEWNKTIANITGYKKMDVIGHPWQAILGNATNKQLTFAMNNALEGCPSGIHELAFTGKAAKPVTLLASFTLRRDSNRHAPGLLCFGQDITELTAYRSNLEGIVEERTCSLNKALEKEKTLLAMKSKFVSIASHEFRVPLTSIQQAAEAIEVATTQKQIQIQLNQIKKNVISMRYLLDDILTSEREEVKEIELRLTKMPLRTIEAFAREVLHSQATGHVLDFQLSGQSPTVITDERLLRNILSNLISNAAKYSPGKDRIQVTVTLDDQYLAISVRDRGIGIPAAEAARLFKAFSRASNVGSIQGTGLGLYIVKKATDLLGGTIGLDSGPGKGTEITVKLPAHPVSQADTAHTNAL